MAFADAVVLTPVSLTELTAVSIAAALTAADGTNGNKFVANRRTILRVKNASGSQITVTLHTNYSVKGLVVPNQTFTVAATTGDVLFTGFADIFKQNDLGQVWITFSDVTTVTCKVYEPL